MGWSRRGILEEKVIVMDRKLDIPSLVSTQTFLARHNKALQLVKKEMLSGFVFVIDNQGNLVTKGSRGSNHEGSIGLVDDSEVSAVAGPVDELITQEMQKVKAVQTLWGGFLEHKDQCPDMWRLSLHFLRKLCGRVELYADKDGESFARSAGLEYDAVHLLPKAKAGLDRVWSAGKLMTMAQQDCPFIHVDGDAFIREPFSLPSFIAQNKEPWLYEVESYRNYYTCWDQFPAHPTNQRPLVSYCFGLVGGTAYSEIAGACEDSLRFMYENSEAIIDLSNRVDRGHVLASVLVEQIWVPIFMEKRGVEISTYLQGSQVNYDAISKRYFHAMGGKLSEVILSEVRTLADKLLRE